MLAEVEADVAGGAAGGIASADPEDLVCTIEELSRIVGRSPPSIRADIQRGAPVVSGGSKGVGYQISARAYHAWLKGEERREAEDREARLNASLQLALKLGGGQGPGAEGGPRRLSPREEKEALEAQVLWTRVERDRLTLIHAAGVEEMLARLGAGVVDRLERLPDELARRLGLDNLGAAEADAVCRRLCEDVADFVGELRDEVLEAGGDHAAAA